jgi:hypothetical protein
MATVTYDKEITGLLVLDPYNDFISEGGKLWDRIRDVAEANDCVPHMLQVLNAARQAKLRVFFQRRRNSARWRSPIHPDGSVDWLAAFRANARRSGSISLQAHASGTASLQCFSLKSCAGRAVGEPFQPKKRCDFRHLWVGGALARRRLANKSRSPKNRHEPVRWGRPHLAEGAGRFVNVASGDSSGRRACATSRWCS